MVRPAGNGSPHSASPASLLASTAAFDGDAAASKGRLPLPLPPVRQMPIGVAMAAEGAAAESPILLSALVRPLSPLLSSPLAMPLGRRPSEASAACGPPGAGDGSRGALHCWHALNIATNSNSMATSSPASRASSAHSSMSSASPRRAASSTERRTSQASSAMLTSKASCCTRRATGTPPRRSSVAASMSWKTSLTSMAAATGADAPSRSASSKCQT